MMAQQEVVDSEVAYLRERDEQVRKLEVIKIILPSPPYKLVGYRFQADILDINQIFRDLGALVYEQGEVISKNLLVFMFKVLSFIRSRYH
jgi:hypothetical protein